MKQKLSKYFIEAFLIGFKGLMSLPFLFLVLMVSDDMHAYQPPQGYGVTLFIILGGALVLITAIMVFTSMFKIWKLTVFAVLLVSYCLVYKLNDDLQYAQQYQSCFEATYQNCPPGVVLKGG